MKNLPKINCICIAISFVIIVIGFALMVRGASGSEVYNPDIFSVRRITIAPMIALFGFIMVIVAILWKPKQKK